MKLKIKAESHKMTLELLQYCQKWFPATGHLQADVEEHGEARV